ncbi:MAG: hypothetical protein MZV70_51620 [Desulfobacterales bacterium]|nr:hypothetical protein [Desulfobacterales bacterium]
MIRIAKTSRLTTDEIIRPGIHVFWRRRGGAEADKPSRLLRILCRRRRSRIGVRRGR